MLVMDARPPFERSKDRILPISSIGTFFRRQGLLLYASMAPPNPTKGNVPIKKTDPINWFSV
jgi:hypothetical protein